jgi:thiol-disulfide isomerase/thioredoxin
MLAHKPKVLHGTHHSGLLLNLPRTATVLMHSQQRSRMHAVPASKAPTAPLSDTSSVVVFTTPGCPFCRKAKQTLQGLEVAYKVSNLALNVVCV